MPRNIKCRRICAEPQTTLFMPQDTEKPYITLSVVELESLRLCDLEGLEQQDAAECMGISRGTLQRILYSARRHTAEALTGGYGIIIQGGQYEIAQKKCGCGKKCKRCGYDNYVQEED